MAEKPLDAVVAELTHETASWGSISVIVALEQTSGGTVTRAREGYMATRHGDRRYARYARSGDHETCVLQGYDETTRCALVRYRKPPQENRQRSITISTSFVDEATTGFAAIPAPLPFFVGLVPIRAAIRAAAVLGPSRVAGRDCTRYLCRAVPGNGGTQDLVYHLDAATSYPLKVESFAAGAQVEAGTPFSVWEAERLDETQGFHVATDSHYATFAPGEPAPQLLNKYHVDLIRFNGAIPSSAFWPVADPGVYINNTITGKAAYNTATGKAPDAAGAAPTGGLPWGAWAATGGITLGVALLFVGLTRQFRRR